MSGDIKDDLYTPVIYPHWMWVLGVALLVAVIGWVLFCLWRWWTSRVGEVTELHTITDARRKKYLVYVDQIADRYADGDLDARGVHLALAGLMRALVPVWPGLANVLATCEVPSFAGENIPDGQPSHDAVTRALTMAVEAVNA